MPSTLIKSSPAYKSYLDSELPTPRTFDALISEYKLSPEFRAEHMQRGATTADISTSCRRHGVSSTLEVLGRSMYFSFEMRGRTRRSPRTNHLLSVLKTLINWGIPREFLETNPCIHVPKLEIDEKGARPWPAWAYRLIEEHAREHMQRTVLLARYTGQRQADVLRMAPCDIEDGGINVTQQKTGKGL